MNKPKAKFWLGVVFALIPIVKQVAEGLGYPLPLPDLGNWGDILAGTSGAAGVGLIAVSPAIGDKR